MSLVFTIIILGGSFALVSQEIITSGEARRSGEGLLYEPNGITFSTNGHSQTSDPIGWGHLLFINWAGSCSPEAGTYDRPYYAIHTIPMGQSPWNTQSVQQLGFCWESSAAEWRIFNRDNAIRRINQELGVSEGQRINQPSIFFETEQFKFTPFKVTFKTKDWVEITGFKQSENGVEFTLNNKKGTLDTKLLMWVLSGSTSEKTILTQDKVLSPGSNVISLNYPSSIEDTYSLNVVVVTSEGDALDGSVCTQTCVPTKVYPTYSSKATFTYILPFQEEQQQITCKVNSDCGGEKKISSYCSNEDKLNHDIFEVSTCINPGAINSYCSTPQIDRATSVICKADTEAPSTGTSTEELPQPQNVGSGGETLGGNGEVTTGASKAVKIRNLIIYAIIGLILIVGNSFIWVVFK